MHVATPVKFGLFSHACWCSVSLLSLLQSCVFLPFWPSCGRGVPKPSHVTVTFRLSAAYRPYKTPFLHYTTQRRDSPRYYVFDSVENYRGSILKCRFTFTDVFVLRRFLIRAVLFIPNFCSKVQIFRNSGTCTEAFVQIPSKYLERTWARKFV
ncbi:unnamed protein product, partial [Ectocarpus sp. 13 AM-2016]